MSFQETLLVEVDGRSRIEDGVAVGVAYNGSVSLVAIVVVVVGLGLGLNSDELEVVGLLCILLSDALCLVK